MVSLLAKIRTWLGLGKKSLPYRERMRGTPKAASPSLDKTNSPAAAPRLLSRAGSRKTARVNPNGGFRLV